MNLISRAEKANKKYNCFTFINDDYNGSRPFSVKANIAVKDFPFDCASKVLYGLKSDYDASLISMLKQKGFSPFATTNMDEFAMGSFGKFSSYGPIVNPWLNDRSAGGSSAGAAVSVSLGLGEFALGSSTGGSVRLPASFCGVKGFKPSYGVFSRFGLVAFGSSLDQIGVLARDFTAIENVFNICNLRDTYDMQTWYRQEGKWEKEIKIAYLPSSLLAQVCSSDVVNVFESGLSALSKLPNVTLYSLEDDLDILNMLKLSVENYLLVSSREAFSNLMRFNGIRYARKSNDGDYEKIAITSRSLFGENVTRRLIFGMESILNKPLQTAIDVTRIKLRKFFDTLFSQYNALFLPTTPSMPPLMNELFDVKDMLLSDIFLSFANLCGLCAGNFPLSNNTPYIGCQLIADRFNDKNLLKLLLSLEKYIEPIDYCAIEESIL